VKWLAQQVRFTIFIDAGWQPNENNIWAALSSRELEVDEQKPREKARRQAGLFKDGAWLEIQLSSVRADIFFVPKTEMPDPLDNLGPVEHILSDATRAVSNWLSNSSVPVSRIAIGTLAVQPTTDVKTGYRELLTQIKSLKFDPSGDVSDFFFQINRPTKSHSIEEVKINRLMKFSVGSFTKLTISGAIGQLMTQKLGESDFSCRLELDVNTTPPDPAGLARDRVNPILLEMSDITMDLLAHGETG
jgi:hypothetical protein